MLFLMPRENALPVFFWNRPTWVSLRSSPEETVVEAAARMVRSVDAEMVVVPPARTRRFFDPVSGQIDAIQVDYAPVLDGLDIESVASANGRVRVTYGVRPRDTEALSIDPERVEALRALGYAEVGEPLAEGVEVGVRLFDRSRARPGLNLFTDAKACATHLMDMEGQVLHSWSGSPCHRWDNTVLLANGDLLVTARETKGRSPAEADAARALLRLGWSGELRWKRRLTAHHDVEVTPSGRILLMAHRFRSIPEVHPEVPVRDHLLLLLSEEGEPIEERSLWDVLQTRPDLLPLQRIRPRRFEGSREVDLFHSNSVEWMRHPQLIGRDPIYGEDTVLVSIRNQDAFVVFAWETEELLWVWGPGEVSNPHDATLLPNGHVLAFDNGLGRGWSRVIEVDPLSREIVWQYRAPDPTDFYSRTRGASQRLSRGHVLITESDTGRAFEVTPEGEIVWEFVNPDLTPEREPGVIVRMRRLEGIDFPELLSRLERGEALPLTD